MFAVDAAFQDSSRFCQLHTGVYAEKFAFVCRCVCANVFAVAQQDFQTVRQIIFSLGVVVVQSAQSVFQICAAEYINTCIDFFHSTFRFGSVLVFHALYKIACFITDDTAIACGIVYHSRYNGYSIFFCAMLRNNAFQCFPCDQRCIPVQDQHILIVFDEIASHFHRVASAFTFCLKGKRHIFPLDGCLHLFCQMTNHNAYGFRTAVFCCVNDILHHGFIHDFMEYFWFLGFHTGTFARCQNDCFQIFHNLLLSQHAPFSHLINSH